MNKNIWLAGLIGLTLGVILTVLLTPISNKYMGSQIGRMMAPAQNIDSHFIEQMIPHHADAIAMGHLALQNAEHQEIKDLGQDIIDAQTSEIDQMRIWYKDWFNSTVPDVYAKTSHSMGSGMMHGGMMNNKSDIETLRTAEPFDKAFIEEMIPHHQMAVMMAQMLKNSSTRPEMKKLADNIIEAQNKEIEQMRNWYSQWYK